MPIVLISEALLQRSTGQPPRQFHFRSPEAYAACATDTVRLVQEMPY
jgi:hypothetical protein